MKDQPRIDPQAAKTALDEERKERVERVRAKLDASLKENRCTIAVGMLLTENKVTPQVQIVPLD